MYYSRLTIFSDVLHRGYLAVCLYRFGFFATFPAYQKVQCSTGTGNVGALPCCPTALPSVVSRVRY
jgi:hypothetical protein